MSEIDNLDAEKERPKPESEHLEHPFEEQEKKSGCITPLGLLAILGVFCGLAAIMVPNFMRARARGQITACKSNLKNLGTAMEMYSTDWSGHYPSSMDMLTPNYLKSIPECPAAGIASYKLITGKNVGYNTVKGGFEDYYLFYCSKDNHSHAGVDGNYPQYDSIAGLLER